MRSDIAIKAQLNKYFYNDITNIIWGYLPQLKPEMVDIFHKVLLMQQIHGIRNVWDSGIVSNDGWKWHTDEEPIPWMKFWCRHFKN